MKKSIVALCLMCVLTMTAAVYANNDTKDLEKPISESAKRELIISNKLIDDDRFTEAKSALKKAILLAPNYVNAHARYIDLQSVLLNNLDQVRREYEELMKKDPDNPVYPLALAIGAPQSSVASKNVWLQKVVDIAPEWSWAHYARASLVIGKDPEAAVAELKRYIDSDGSWLPAYHTLLFVQGTTLRRLDDALATAKKLAARPESHSWDFIPQWRLRLAKAGGTEEAKNDLRKEMEKLAESSRDVKMLDAVRLAYKDLLIDKERASKVETKIREIDAAWYPERGRGHYLTTANISGNNQRLLFFPNRQNVYFDKITELAGSEMQPEEKISGLEKLLFLSLSSELKHYLYRRIFVVAEKVGDTSALIKYGDLLFINDHTDVVIPAKIAFALADKKNPQAALRYASIAVHATATFRPMLRPANHSLTNEEWKKEFPEELQRKVYSRMRALALDAVGWSNYLAGNIAPAETYLKQSIELNRTEQNLSHLSEVFNKLERKAESLALARESDNLYLDNLKQNLTKEPAKGFELATLDGSEVKLSDLKGKVVMIDFWATWCIPCRKSLPTLAKLYEKYKSQGFEILYISIDEETDKSKVASYVKEKKILFPVMLDGGVKEMYNVQAFPTTIFIDRQSIVRHRDVGFLLEKSPRMMETTIELLLSAK